MKTYKQIRKRKTENVILYFLLIEFCIYITFLYLDILIPTLGFVSNTLKYIGICLCAAFVFVKTKDVDDFVDQSILKVALIFTVISDLFLLLLDLYVPGLISFCIVQALYLMRLHRWKKNIFSSKFQGNILKYVVRNILCFLLVITLFFCLHLELNLVLIIASFYFVSISFNVIDSIIVAIQCKKRKFTIFSIGLVLFLMCDINVGLFNLSQFIQVDFMWYQKLFYIVSTAIWFFYLPSQVAISLSKYDK